MAIGYNVSSCLVHTPPPWNLSAQTGRVFLFVFCSSALSSRSNNELWPSADELIRVYHRLCACSGGGFFVRRETKTTPSSIIFLRQRVWEEIREEGRGWSHRTTRKRYGRKRAGRALYTCTYHALQITCNHDKIDLFLRVFGGGWRWTLGNLYCTCIKNENCFSRKLWCL